MALERRTATRSRDLVAAIQDTTYTTNFVEANLNIVKTIVRLIRHPRATDYRGLTHRCRSTAVCFPCRYIFVCKHVLPQALT